MVFFSGISSFYKYREISLTLMIMVTINVIWKFHIIASTNVRVFKIKTRPDSITSQYWKHIDYYV